jgi:hypothetical protein
MNVRTILGEGAVNDRPTNQAPGDAIARKGQLPGCGVRISTSHSSDTAFPDTGL